uniref:Very-long-chain 3-oxoacyl-CoA reductase-like n=1 Tax=Ciona intestinalis TaxID=7719 RepID=F6TK16_CIOIN|nr:very-long-chain 3-oxoacyl-CoA reductase-like [Ciona intestinalis]|eukprot:XP_002130556.1 very-long-chain 3-oxoacyl-CoA reductase-like [Ciona intestinalis]
MECWLFTYIGIATCSIVAFKFVSKIVHALRIYVFPTVPKFSKYGKWTVVTGCTSGIGKSIAKALAARGQNIALISRNPEKLKTVATELETKYNVQTKYLVIDFTQDESIYEKIEEFLQGMDIGTLVNNVGMASPLAFYLDTKNLSQILPAIMKVNVMSVFKMTQIVLPGMMERKRGLILNISSASSLVPVNGFSVYGATKALVNYFSKCISRECEGHGITVQSVKPFFVSTNMVNNVKPNMLVMDADYYVNSLLGTIGKERESDGCWQHGLQGFFVRHMTEGTFNALMKRRMKTMQRNLSLAGKAAKKDN